MLSKLKVFFLVATCSLSLGLNFLLPVFSSQKTTLAVGSPVLPGSPVFNADEYAKSWTSEERKKITNKEITLILVFTLLFAKSPEIVAIDPKTRKDAVYKFDRVVSAFKQQRREYKDLFIFLSVKLSQFFSLSAQNQILQFYERGGNHKTGDIKTKWVAEYKKIIVDVWNTIQPLFYQMTTLGIQEYEGFYGQTVDFANPVIKHDEWDYFKDHKFVELEASVIFTTFDSLQDMLFFTTSVPFAKKTFTAALDKDWLPKLQLLQSAPGLLSLRVGREDVDVSSLTSSAAQSIADLNKEQTDILAKFTDTTLQDLQKLVAPHIKKLTNYKKTIQTSLGLFAKYGITKSNLNGKNYDLSELLKSENISKPVAGLSVPAVQQLGNLYKVTPYVSPQHFIAAFAPIKTYKDNIQNNLNLFAENDITTFTLDDVDYQLNHLLDTNNLGKPAVDLFPDAAKQLKTLYDAKVKSEDFTTALNQILTTRKTQVQKEKEAKAKVKKTALTIGFATGGGVLLLAGGAGGFLYWFYKIKK